MFKGWCLPTICISTIHKVGFEGSSQLPYGSMLTNHVIKRGWCC